MKIKAHHYNALKEAIAKLNKDDIKEHRLNLPFHVRPPKDIELRLRWDCLYASKAMDELPLYHYLNDNHIDTALRSIFKELQL